MELIEKFKDLLDFLWLSETYFITQFTYELIKNFNEIPWPKIIWRLTVSRMKGPWSMELIEKYEDKWHWKDMSRNGSLPWSMELIEKYEDKWDWREMSKNSYLHWSMELIEKYEDK